MQKPTLEEVASARAELEQDILQAVFSRPLNIILCSISSSVTNTLLSTLWKAPYYLPVFTDHVWFYLLEKGNLIRKEEQKYVYTLVGKNMWERHYKLLTLQASLENNEV